MARRVGREAGASSRWRAALWTSSLGLEGAPGAFSGGSRRPSPRFQSTLEDLEWDWREALEVWRSGRGRRGGEVAGTAGLVWAPSPVDSLPHCELQEAPASPSLWGCSGLIWVCSVEAPLPGPSAPRSAPSADLPERGSVSRSWWAGGARPGPHSCG